MQDSFNSYMLIDLRIKLKAERWFQDQVERGYSTSVQEQVQFGNFHIFSISNI